MEEVEPTNRYPPIKIFRCHQESALADHPRSSARVGFSPITRHKEVYQAENYIKKSEEGEENRRNGNLQPIDVKWLDLGRMLTEDGDLVVAIKEDNIGV